MSEDRALFVPPTKYPDPPKDMWYEIPEKVPEPRKPKPIFPWEGRAKKATRVFSTFKAPTPPPVLEPGPVETPATDAKDATYPTYATDATQESQETESPPTAAIGFSDLWENFQQRTNVWDDMPEIERYVRAFTQSRRGKLQVLHQAHAQSSGDVKLPPEARRPSMRVTDFPTEMERPSLPVTPAPIRRLSFWSEERDEAGELPAAEGVPTQEEWVRRFSSYPKPEFPALSPPLDDPQGYIPGFWRCQFCGRQNPIAKLEEWQRRQSKFLETGPELHDKDIPTREMPGSKSLAEVEEKAISPAKASQMSKPVLREPKF